jgi:hypothetical protein
MRKCLQALNKPGEAFLAANNKWVAWGLVILTILLNTLIEPMLKVVQGHTEYVWNWQSALLAMMVSAATYLAISAVLWLVCKCFGSKTPLDRYFATWGLTYFPTALCAIVVAVTESYFYLFWNSVAWGLVFNILFGGILIWKTILYVLYLREVAQLRRGKLAGVFIVVGIFIALLAITNGYFGVKTPIL